MQRLLEITNATKAQIIALLNAVLGVLLVFGVALTDPQIAAIMLLGNAVLGLWVALTYQLSAKRAPEL